MCLFNVCVILNLFVVSTIIISISNLSFWLPLETVVFLNTPNNKKKTGRKFIGKNTIANSWNNFPDHKWSVIMEKHIRTILKDTKIMNKNVTITSSYVLNARKVEFRDKGTTVALNHSIKNGKKYGKYVFWLLAITLSYLIHSHFLPFVFSFKSLFLQTSMSFHSFWLSL